MALDNKISMRVNKESFDTFVDVSKNVHGKKPQVLVRELMEAVVDGRVKITPTEEQLKSIKQSTELYHVN